MKLLDAFRRFDDKLLRSRPVLWVLGVHIYIPLVVVISIILTLIGATYSLSPLPRWSDYRDFYASTNLIMVLPTITLAILFIIRQVKFNSKRIHTSLPYTYSFRTFLYYIAVFAFITAMPMAANVGAFLRAELELNDETYSQDREILDNGYAHMYRLKNAVDNGEVYEYDYDRYNDPRRYTMYKYNLTRDSIIFFRSSMSSYYGNGQLDTISLEQARQEIRDFRAIAIKYGARFEHKSEDEIIRTNCFAPKVYLRNSKDDHVAYNHIGFNDDFQRAINYNEHYEVYNGPFFVGDIYFWKYYLLIALGIAVLLIVLCSVRIAHFGWAMLISALQPTVFGILFALLEFALPNFHNDEETFILILLILFTSLAIFVAFFSNFKSTFRKAYAISLHIYVPFIVPMFMALIRDLRDCCSRRYAEVHCECVELLTNEAFREVVVIASVASALLATWVFGRFYRKIYINPQSR